MVNVSLPQDLENEILDNLADEVVAELHAFEKTLIDSGIPTMKDMPPAERLAHYVQITDPEDAQYLLNMPDYFDRYKQGLVPILKSPRWVELLSIPELFREVQQDFKMVYRTQVLDKMNGPG